MHPYESDRLLPLALSLRNSPSCYVAIVGAGLSTGSGIPAAGEIVDRLIDQVAAARGVNSPVDPWQWFEAEMGTPPTYQGLLQTLGPSTGDRYAILRPFFAHQANDEALARQPNDGHRGLARLAKLGLLKIFVTTNFDHLIEEALAAEGLNPTIIATEEDWRNAPPLDTQQAVVIHIHGEWQRPDSLRNTDTELGAYPKWVELLLQRVLEGRGLLLVGWSARFDPALRQALLEGRSARYSKYWIDLNEPQGEGRDLALALGAILIRGDAQTILTSTVATVDVLENQQATVSSGLEVIVARAKKELSSTHQPVDVLDAFGYQLDRLRELQVLQSPVQGEDSLALQNRAEVFRLIRPAADLATVISMYGDDKAVRRLLSAIQRFARPSGSYGLSVLMSQQQMPGVILFDAAGIGATCQEDWSRVSMLLNRVLVPNIYDALEEPLSQSVDLTQALAGRVGAPDREAELAQPLALLRAFAQDVNAEAHVIGSTELETATERWQLLWEIAYFTKRRRTLGVSSQKLRQSTEGFFPTSLPWARSLLTGEFADNFKIGTGAINEYARAMARDAAKVAAMADVHPPGDGWVMSSVGPWSTSPAERESWRSFLRRS